MVRIRTEDMLQKQKANKELLTLALHDAQKQLRNTERALDQTQTALEQAQRENASLITALRRATYWTELVNDAQHKRRVRTRYATHKERAAKQEAAKWRKMRNDIIQLADRPTAE